MVQLRPQYPKEIHQRRQSLLREGKQHQHTCRRRRAVWMGDAPIHPTSLCQTLDLVAAVRRRARVEFIHLVLAGGVLVGDGVERDLHALRAYAGRHRRGVSARCRLSRSQAATSGAFAEGWTTAADVAHGRVIVAVD